MWHENHPRIHTGSFDSTACCAPSYALTIKPSSSFAAQNLGSRLTDCRTTVQRSCALHVKNPLPPAPREGWLKVSSHPRTRNLLGKKRPRQQEETSDDGDEEASRAGSRVREVSCSVQPPCRCLGLGR